MEESIKEKPVQSVPESAVKTKLRYPLRSALKSKEEKPPVPDLSTSSASRRTRGRAASTVSQSTSVLDLSADGGKSAKPPRRLSIPTKSAISSASKSLGNITPISETRSKRSNNANGKSVTPVSGYGTARSTSRRKVDDLSSASYWLSQIKLSESASKHSISLGFFKLAFESGCEPLQRMRDELKSYAKRNNIGELTDAVKELYDIYNLSENSEQFQVSDTCSQVPEEGTMSLDDELKSSSSISATVDVTPEALTIDASKVSTAKKETVSKNISPARTRRSLNINSVNSRVAPKLSVSTPAFTKVTPKGFNTNASQVSTAKLTDKKETGTKNNPPGRTRRSLNNSSVNSRSVSEIQGHKSQKKAEKITRPDVNEQKQKAKKHGNKSTGPVNPSVASETVEENKENLDASPAEEITLAEA